MNSFTVKEFCHAWYHLRIAFEREMGHQHFPSCRIVLICAEKMFYLLYFINQMPVNSLRLAHKWCKVFMNMIEIYLSLPHNLGD